MLNILGIGLIIFLIIIMIVNIIFTAINCFENKITRSVAIALMILFIAAIFLAEADRQMIMFAIG